VRTVSIIRVIIALMMEAVRVSETSIYPALHPRRLLLHTRRRENVKSHEYGMLK
jgi:hypothetical protein